MEERVLVFSTERIHIAEIVKNMLWDNGIPAFYINKRDSLYHFGEIDLYVTRDDVIKAKSLISKLEF